MWYDREVLLKAPIELLASPASKSSSDKAWGWTTCRLHVRCLLGSVASSTTPKKRCNGFRVVLSW